MGKISEIIEITSFDEYKFKGKLTVPQNGDVQKLVIYINGSGANTYDNKRNGFNYFDLFADEFSKRDIAFFSYNTRGCDIGENQPMYVDINYDEYKSYLPLNSVEDIYHMIKTIKAKKYFENCKIYLPGWSEGTIIAPLVAEKYPDMIDGILLAGYVNKNMRDVLEWQNNGGASMAWYRGNFKADENGRISKEAYNADPYNVVATILQNATFENLDTNEDGYITEEDFADTYHLAVGYSLNDVLSAIERKDDEWLKTNYGGGIIPLTSGWFLQHFSLRSNMEVLPTLNLPIHIFHGTMDQCVDVREVYKIDQIFKKSGKTNLKINVFDRNGHDLNYMNFIIKKEVPIALTAIFDTVKLM
ncbi:MAG: alpha/beta fold hydrolase [Oscillospiraceae bacterium]